MLLSPSPAAVAAKRSIVLHDAVARNHNGDPIVAVGSPHGPLRTRMSDRPGKPGIAGRAAIRDAPQFLPRPLLKGRPRTNQGDGKRAPLPLEVLLKLCREAIQMGIVPGYDD